MAPISFRKPIAGRRRGSAPAVQTAALVAAMQAVAGCAAESSTPVRHTDAAIALPSPHTAGAVSLEDAIATRRSVRELSREPLATEEIGQLFWAAQGITDEASGHRAAPSAGALYPLEVYAVTADGVYHYLPRRHEMERVLSGDLRAQLAVAALGQSAVESAGVDFVVTGVVSRTAGKYGSRAERFVHMEAGHAAQNMLLEATALHLGAVPIGGFTDDAVNSALALPEGEQALYIIAVGKRAN